MCSQAEWAGSTPVYLVPVLSSKNQGKGPRAQVLSHTEETLSLHMKIFKEQSSHKEGILVFFDNLERNKIAPSP